MTIHLTSAAAEYIQTCLSKQPNAVGFQVGIVKTGCSGLSYEFQYLQEPLPQAECFDCEGIQIWVKKDHLYALNGLHLDYVKQGLNYVLAPFNPNAQNECGCGESFNVDVSLKNSHQL